MADVKDDVLHSGRRKTIVYILGTGHSGTTLLDLLLNAHSNVTGLGEVEKIGARIARGPHCGCGASFAKCPFWGDIFNNKELSQFLDAQIQHITQGNPSFFFSKENFSFIKKNFKSQLDLTPEKYVTFMEQIYDYAFHKSDSTLLVDSTKNPHLVEAMHRYSDKYDIKVIHLVRDVRGVTWSYMKKYGSCYEPIRRWLGSQCKITFLCFKLGLKKHTCTYENLSRSPESAMQDTMHFIGLPFEVGQLNYWNTETHYPGGNFKMLQEKKQITIDEQWRNEMPKSCQKLALILAGWLNLYYQWRYRK